MELGSIFFSAKPLVEDQGGLRTALATKYWATPAATPPLASASGEAAGPAPHVTASTGGASAVVPAETRSLAVYRRRPDRVFVIDRIVPVITNELTDGAVSVKLDAGDWAISALDRRGVESRGAVVTVH